MKKPEIYREQALEALQERSEFQEAIRIITPKAWIYLVVFLLFFILGILWLIFGRLTTIVEGQGMIFAKDAQIINVVSPILGGYVKKLLINPGERVKKGQLIAILANPNMAGEIKELRKYIDLEKNKLNQFNITAKKEIATRLKNIQDSIQHAQKIHDDLMTKEKHLGGLLKIQEAAFKKGILSRLELNEIQVNYYDVKEQINKNLNTLIEFNQNKNDYIESWNTKIRDQQEKVTQLEYNLRKSLNNLQLTENVFSPVNGIVSTNYVKEGDFLSEKQTLINIVTYSKELEVIAFFDVDSGKKIKVGMPAKIFPKHINSLEYGGVKGKIAYISELPISPGSIQSLLENQKLVDKFVESGPVFRVKIQLIPTKSTVSGYVWTTSKGPAEKLSIGSIVTVGVVAKKQHPLAVILPTIKSVKNWMVE